MSPSFAPVRVEGSFAEKVLVLEYVASHGFFEPPAVIPGYGKFLHSVLPIAEYPLPGTHSR